MRKPANFICENKDGDQLHSCAADQWLRFRFIEYRTIPRNFEPLAIFCGCTARFVLNLIGNPEDRFSCATASMMCYSCNTLTVPVTHLYVSY